MKWSTVLLIMCVFDFFFIVIGAAASILGSETAIESIKENIWRPLAYAAAFAIIEAIENTKA